MPRNVAEGAGTRAGRRRQSYEIALGEARETLANLEGRRGHRLHPRVGVDVRRQLDHIIGTLVKLVR